MDRALDSLSSDFRPIVDKILAKLVERRVAVMIVQTSRTPEQAAANVANKTSATIHSKHLPRFLRGPVHPEVDLSKCDAIDLCPFETYQMFGDEKLHWTDDDSPQAKAAWGAIGEEAEKLANARWGGRWHAPHDPGHIEFLFPGEHYEDIPSSAAAYIMHGLRT